MLLDTFTSLLINKIKGFDGFEEEKKVKVTKIMKIDG
jgi:hypothetical protein